MQPTTLTDAELVLRPPRIGDVDDLVDALQDPEVSVWIDTIPHPYRPGDGERFVREISDPGWHAGTSVAWLVTVDEQVLGGVGLHLRRAAIWEVGYWLRPDARRRGLATRAVRRVCRFAFAELGAQRVEWQAVVGNLRSREVARRTGFRFEGTCRARVGAGGERPLRDAWLAGLLPEDLDEEPPPSPAITQVELVAGALLLRPWKVDDVAAVHRACQDADIQRWTTVPVPYTVQDAEQFVAASPNQWADGQPSFAIVAAGDGQLLGSIGVVATSPAGDTEIGYWVAPWARHRGVASQATAAVSRWLLLEVGRPRLVWHAEVGNLASRRAAEVAGFVIEGTARRGMVHRGERVDTWVGSMLATDLPTRH